MSDLFSKKHDDSMRGIALDARDTFRRLGIEDLAMSGDGDLLTKGKGIDDIASDNFRAQKAIRNGLEPSSATWEEIAAVAQARARANLALPDSATLQDIYNAMGDLEDRVIVAAKQGKLGALDAGNPEVVFAMTTAAKKLPEYAADLVAIVRANLK